jgi:hypothetical protein
VGQLSVHSSTWAGASEQAARGDLRGLFNNTRLAMPEADDLPKPERVPFFQRVLDNPFLLLFIGIVMPTVFYILWGIMEIATIPVAP